MRIEKIIKVLMIVTVMLLPLVAEAQVVTSASGQVIDEFNGEPLPFAQIVFEGSTIGTTSDLDGNFEISNTRGLIRLSIRMMGYKTQTVTLKPGRANPLLITMESEAVALEDVVIRPTEKIKEHYRRKGNPAVELIKNVIRNKDKNRVGYQDTYEVQSYEKLVMALTPFDFNLDRNSFWQKFKFLENYLDTIDIETGVLVVDSGKVMMDSISIGQDSTLIRVDSVVIARDENKAKANEAPILTMSLRETVAREYHQFSPRKDRKIIEGFRWDGLDELLDNGGFNQNVQAVFQPMNIFNNDINLMLNRFVSPLSSSLANSFYHYYIMDTIQIEDKRCIDLAFVPVNSESFGFTGHLYIVNDSTYALKRYKINVPHHINLNWLSNMSIEETFEQQPDGRWASKMVRTNAKLAIRKKSKHSIFARQTRYFHDYKMGATVPDSLFYMAGNTIEVENYNHKPHDFWVESRPFPLTGKETVVDSLQVELMRVPVFHGIVNTVQDLIQEFIPTSKQRDSSRWDFGPIFNTISYNEQEGARLRIGGMTTANLNKRWFTSEYIAYGFSDRRVKGGITILHSFHDKPYHPYESLRHNLSLVLSYDLEELGQTYRVLDRDHIFNSIKFNYNAKPMQYIGRIRLKYEKEWANQFSIITWADFMNNQPNGSGKPYESLGKTQQTELNRWMNWGRWRPERSPLTMQYLKRNADGSYTETPFYHDAMWTLQLRYSPGGYIYNDRQGIESPFNLWKDAPVFRFTNEAGYILEDKYFYNRIQFSAETRVWLSAFGHLDIQGDLGYVVGKKVPFTKLFIPVSNQSILMDPKAFSLMQPMEFLMDRYASLHTTYYLKGWIFNRIPGIKKLKLREVLSFHILAGYLGDRNNPLKTDGLYELPSTYMVDGQPMQARTTFADKPYYDENGVLRYKYGYMPYMEITAGIENIFKIIRIEYVRRLTHLEPMPGQKLGPWQRNGIRLTFRLAM